MTAFLPAVVPVALIILIGYFSAKILPLDTQTLSQVTIYILAPALVLDSLYRTTLSSQSTTGLLVGYSLTVVILYLILLVLGKILNLSPDSKKSLLAAALFSNNGNIGLAVIAFSLGYPGLERAVIYMIGSSILMFGLGPALLKGNGFWLGVNLTLKLPLFWATVGGLVLRVLAIKLPFNLDKSIEQLGLASIPVALLILGMQLASTKFEIGKDELFASMIRLLLAPLIAYLVGQLIGLRGLDLQVLVLQSAMPTAVNAVVMVAEFGGDPRYVARAIVFSTLVSFFTLPLFLWGFARNLT